MKSSTTTSFLAVAALLVGVAAGAQVPGAAAKAAARSAVAATNAHIEAEQTVEPRRVAQKDPLQKTVERPGTRLEISTIDTSGTPTLIMREAYGFSRDGRRDPFVSLLTTNELRPTMSDLRLTGILFDQATDHSVATLRDLATNASYKVSEGSTLGRMRVSAIRHKTIVFTIDEFGMTRQDSLVLGDTTKVRGK